MSDYQVAVVGSGAAGLCAALEASNAGAKVLLIEGSDVVGGSSRLSSGVVLAADTRYQKAAGIEDSADELFAFYMSTNQWKVEAAVVQRLAEESGPTVHMLGDLGVRFYEQIYFSGDEPKARGHIAIGEGAAIVDALYAEVRRRDNIEIVLNRRVDRLIVEDGRVVGVAVGSGTGADELRADAIVLTTGGFGANQDLWREHLPEVVEHSRDFMWYLGADTAQGDIFGLVEPVDAQILGHNRCQINVRPNFAHEPEGYLPGWLVLVNGDGYRFFNEMAPYSVTDPIIRAQPGPIYAILDAEAKKAAQPKASMAAKKTNIPGATWEDWVEPVIDEMLDNGRVIKADSIKDLAEQTGLPEKRLRGTIERYNEGVAAGRDTFYLKEPSVMRKVETPPFYATEVRLTQLGLTCVGPRIDPDCRVLDTRSQTVPGLYAAGECTGGVLGDVYMGSGNSLSNATTMGRVAGRAAAREALGR